jgi:hypothetical protein
MASGDTPATKSLKIRATTAACGRYSRRGSVRLQCRPDARVRRPPASAEAETAWRERPPPWPRAWQTKWPNRVVAHATVLRLTTSPMASRLSGGRERRPMTIQCNSQHGLKLVRGNRETCSFASPAIREEPGERDGEHLARGPVPPPCSPSCSPPTWTAESGTSSRCSSSCESDSRSDWQCEHRFKRRFNACGGRLRPCDHGADNRHDKRG